MKTKRGTTSAPTQASDTRYHNARQKWSMAVSTQTHARAAEAATVDTIRTAPPTNACMFVSSSHTPGIPPGCQATYGTPSSALLELRRRTRRPGTHPASAERLGRGTAGEPVAVLLTHRRRCRAAIAWTYLRLHPRDRSLSDRRVVSPPGQLGTTTATTTGRRQWETRRGCGRRGENRAVTVKREATVGVVAAAAAGWAFPAPTTAVARRRPGVPVENNDGRSGPGVEDTRGTRALKSQNWTVIGGCCDIAGASTHVAWRTKCT